MEAAIWMFLSGLALALLCGLARLAFAKQKPYRRLFRLLNSCIFFAGLTYACAVMGYIIGVGVTMTKYAPNEPNDAPLSWWLFAPNVILLVIWGICLLLLVLPRHIGLADD